MLVPVALIVPSTSCIFSFLLPGTATALESGIFAFWTNSRCAASPLSVPVPVSSAAAIVASRPIDDDDDRAARDPFVGGDRGSLDRRELHCGATVLKTPDVVFPPPRYGVPM